jgi:hypothetical protein
MAELTGQLQCCHYRVRAPNGRLRLHLRSNSAGVFDHVDADPGDAVANDAALLACIESQMRSIGFPNCVNVAEILVAVTFRGVCWI